MAQKSEKKSDKPKITAKSVNKPKQKSRKQQEKEYYLKLRSDLEGMSPSQRFEYINMSDVEREKFLRKFRGDDKKEKELNDKKDNKKYEEYHAKIIKNGKEQIYVMVLNMRGQPLMPTSPAKARTLLKSKKAKVVCRCPFVIQLMYVAGENKQPIELALDTGYKHVGFSATTDKRELICGEVVLRTDIPDKLNEKAMYRKGRRNRNTRYREARFDNRGIPKGWLPPSIQHKLDTYIRLVQKFAKLLPITGITVEISPFDTQKMQNPEISGIEYQQGTLQGYEVREYLLEKWGRKCAYCGNTEVPFEVEHIIPPGRIGLGGSDRVSNLTIACHDCNQKKSNMTAAEFGHPEVQILAQKSMKDAAFMNIVRTKLVDILREEFPNYEINSTYGYVTKYWRIKNEIEKTHSNDAFVISTLRSKEKLENIGGIIRSKKYQVKQIRRNDRSLQTNRKGYKSSIRRQRHKYSPGDLVIKRSSIQTTGWGDKINRRNVDVYTVKGVFNYGKSIRLKNPIVGEDDINMNIKEVKLLKYGSGLLFQLPKNEKLKGIISDKMINEKKKEKEQDGFTVQRNIEDAWN